MTLREILHAHAPTLSLESTMRDAVDKMDIYQFAALPILDEDSKPVAVITEGDICRLADKEGSLVRIASDLAFDHATKSPTVAHPDEEVSEALHRMLRSGLTVLPIVEHQRYCGIVLRVDLMQAILQDMATDRA
ncbi:MAG: CBS domain-containing protein [Armatimonadetes bacterium]|nr:CBS domain-containing protein [Armatimonadota bacterium]